MAFITVTDTANNILVDFGVYSGVIPSVLYSKAPFRKTAVTFQLAADESFVRVEARNGQSWSISFDGAGEILQIDSINAVAPTSNSDLYDKLIALIG